MPIITIIRGAFGAGPEVAERVAEDLGYRCVGREVLIEASNRYGIPEAKYEEVLESGPHWWERWRESLRLYRITLQAAMCEMARDGKIVYHGHMGQELLPGVAHVLKVLLTAPLDYQVEKVREREDLDEAGGPSLCRRRQQGAFPAHGSHLRRGTGAMRRATTWF